VPFILRKIRKARWRGSEVIGWLSSDDLQADALVDLATKDNRLSVYIVATDRFNLERILAALAGNCDFISNLDYVLLEENALDEINIKIASVKGETPDEEVNAVHRDLVELSATQILALAKLFSTRGERNRLTGRRVLELLVRAVDSGQIERDRLKVKPEEIAKIDAFITKNTSSPEAPDNPL
jgi:hypothetical protein